MPTIVVDAMGSDNYPDPEIEGAAQAAQEFGEEILLAGPEEVLQPKLDALGASAVRVVHAPEVFKMTDSISAGALRESKSTMAVATKLLKSGEADAFVTVGNTGAAMANGLITLGRIRGIKRPALTVQFPVKNGHCVVLDIGANVECKPEYLVQFALMGSVYAERILGKDSPKVGMLSNGEEAGKGNDLVKAAYPLLESTPINFIGNVESKELFGGEADVVVTDGFTGNILLKTSEAVAKMLTQVLREEMTSSVRTTLGALLARPAFGKVRQMLDPSEVGAAPLLGINGLVFVGHGRSGTKAIVSAIRLARQAVQADLLGSIQSAL
jgi:glycerol-3-phosphate acyltransferase PlsX